MDPKEGSHPHRWRIAEAVNSTSVGVCQICGTERVFNNWTICSEDTSGMRTGAPRKRSSAPVGATGRSLTRAS